MEIKWEQSDKQRHFCESKADEVLYGGAAGGGKSHVQCQDALMYAIQYPKSKQLILRRTFSDLEKSIIRTTREMYPKKLGKYNESKHFWKFKNGSIIDFGYCDKESDVYQYQSAEYDVIRFDELTHFSEDMYIYLLSRNRGANDYPKSVKSSTNPGGIGHTWVKKRFIDIGPPNTVYDFFDEDGEPMGSREFIPSLLTDNPWLLKKDPAYKRKLKNLSKTVYQQLRFGDWDSWDGQFFDEWDREIHVIKPFEIPKAWRRYFAMDYGLDMLAGYWIAVDDADNAYVYREIYQSNLVISAAAESIKAKQGTDIPEELVAPPDLWNRRQDTGKSVAEIFAEHGLLLRKVSNDRVQGWLDLKEWLKPRKDEFGQKKPKLRIFENCTEIIRTLPSLVHDEHKFNDISDKIHEYTHGPDALRYWASSRPRPNDAVLEEDPDEISYEDEVESFLGYGNY
ncbi:MAG: phage terminase large subunit [Oscillospiraceae bacterium]|nr:phage terminase large subunit [Oscillospiraceae bacterium]